MMTEAQLIDHLPYIRNCARAYERRPHALDDIVQSVALRAWARRDKFQDENARGWFWSLTRTVCLNGIRGETYREVLGDDGDEEWLGGRVEARADNILFAKELLRLAEKNRNVLAAWFLRLRGDMHAVAVLGCSRSALYRYAAKGTGIMELAGEIAA
jgi:DNA-directed RNA polymerase specialized sigma24 family protein